MPCTAVSDIFAIQRNFIIFENQIIFGYEDTAFPIFISTFWITMIKIGMIRDTFFNNYDVENIWEEVK